MKVGLVGYSGVGKSTVFQWLTGATPDPGKIQQGQVAIADVADDRLRKIAEVYKPKKLTFAKVEFLDTPGLMADDRKDNPRRLGILREANGMVVVLDGFSGAPLAEQLRKFREELLYADLEIVMNRVPKVEAQMKKAKPAKEREQDELELATLKRVIAGMEAGKFAKELNITEEEEKPLRSFQLLTLKPETVLVNRGDSGFNDPLPKDLLDLCPSACQAPVKLEMELAALSEEDRQMFMSDLGFTKSFREATVRNIFYAMGRIVFFTAGHDECRSWAMDKGGTAVDGAACIHNDLAARFVRARVVGHDHFVQCGFSEKEAKAKGLERLEGKQYIVQDGDVIEIL
ncbi:MAG: redox-regulated ATPase YchF [Planctomycetia bacterium]|nr:redox-regulated ATPase YchF [Planctomycetia bacterium]